MMMIALKALTLVMKSNKEKRALGGPMFSIEENEKLRREKMRGGDFKEKSSESSNGSSGPPSPCAEPSNLRNQNDYHVALAEKKRIIMEREKQKQNGNGNFSQKKDKQ
mmetsp:Transcript_13609/g.12076  ORF Transcript_13609/g.12076 Transcript_13609/m.12076 type:complete len:108 (-) Transcript_13609:30-353(-)